MKFPFITLVLVGAMTSACTATSTSFVNPTSTPDTEVPAATPTQFVADTVGDKTQCPVENPNMVPNFAVPPDAFPPTNLEQPILDFLNAGGSRHALIAFLRGAGAIAEENLFAKDVTGDATPELIVGESHLRVYACQNQKYYVAADIKPWTYQSPTPVFIGDMNQNGVPELVIDRLDDVAVDIVHEYQILEWDGQQFRNLISPLDLENRYIRANSIMEGWIVIGGITHSRESNQWAVRDTDNNGTLELILTGGISVNNEGMYMGPYRVVTTIYMWNGKNFVIYDTEYEPPQFRFQAVQDADYAVIKGQYDKALTLYQQVIFSDTLAWWSEDMREYEMAQVGISEGTPTPTLPAPDTKDRENLSAYAYYRIMLLYVFHGKLSDAQATYSTLQDKFPANRVGHPYAELGKIFWTNYQTTQNMGTACAKAIEFAASHENEILYYIGSNIRHGWQSFYYEPEDICPFK